MSFGLKAEKSYHGLYSKKLYTSKNIPQKSRSLFHVSSFLSFFFYFLFVFTFQCKFLGSSNYYGNSLINCWIWLYATQTFQLFLKQIRNAIDLFSLGISKKWQKYKKKEEKLSKCTVLSLSLSLLYIDGGNIPLTLIHWKIYFPNGYFYWIFVSSYFFFVLARPHSSLVFFFLLSILCVDRVGKLRSSSKRNRSYPMEMLTPKGSCYGLAHFYTRYIT